VKIGPGPDDLGIKAHAYSAKRFGIQPPDEIGAKRYSNRKPADETWDREFADSPLEESGFEPLVPPATEMLIVLPRGITHATRMLAVGDIGPVLRLC
jgi:hypothetical protein